MQKRPTVPSPGTHPVMRCYNNIEEMLQHVAEGSRDAFRQFFYLYYKPLCNYAASIVNNTIVAEEVVSDMFFKLWLKREMLPDVQNIEAYLYTAVKNKALSCLRNAAAQHTATSLDSPPVPGLIETHHPEYEILQTELQNIVQSAIETLPSKCRMIFKMAKIEGLPYKKIAELLSISVRTIDAQLTIAHNKLHFKLRHYVDEE